VTSADRRVTLKLLADPGYHSPRTRRRRDAGETAANGKEPEIRREAGETAANRRNRKSAAKPAKPPRTPCA